MNDRDGYEYYSSNSTKIDKLDRERLITAANKLGLRRLNPGLDDPDYLTLRERRRIFQQILQKAPNVPLHILDIGGRIQPYRLLIEQRCVQYIALDLQITGLTSVVGVGESLPFNDQSFELVICAQMLSYAASPQQVVNEMQRVLIPGGVLFLSAPAFSPQHHDERWRFLPEGYRLLLAKYSKIEIFEEGHSGAGIFNTLNRCLAVLGTRHYYLSRIFSLTLIPLFNLMGRGLERVSHNSTYLTTNYSVIAIK
jgi:SAM-dependent methyltransferase